MRNFKVRIPVIAHEDHYVEAENEDAARVLAAHEIDPVPEASVRETWLVEAVDKDHGVDLRWSLWPAEMGIWRVQEREAWKDLQSMEVGETIQIRTHYYPARQHGFVKVTRSGTGYRAVGGFDVTLGSLDEVFAKFPHIYGSPDEALFEAGLPYTSHREIGIEVPIDEEATSLEVLWGALHECELELNRLTAETWYRLKKTWFKIG